MAAADINRMTPQQEVRLNTATTWLPLTLVGGIIGVAIYGAWALSTERSTIYGQIGQVSAEVRALTANVQRLTDAIGRPDSNSFTRQEWIMDCLRAQILNPNWSCPYGPSVSVHTKTQ